jgi:hypothetical protein
MNLKRWFRFVVAVVGEGLMPFYDVNVLEALEYVDLPNAIPPVAAVKLPFEGEVEHLAVEIVGFDTKLQKR